MHAGELHGGRYWPEFLHALIGMVIGVAISRAQAAVAGLDGLRRRPDPERAERLGEVLPRPRSPRARISVVNTAVHRLVPGGAAPLVGVDLHPSQVR